MRVDEADQLVELQVSKSNRVISRRAARPAFLRLVSRHADPLRALLSRRSSLKPIGSVMLVENALAQESKRLLRRVQRSARSKVSAWVSLLPRLRRRVPKPTNTGR